VLVWLLIGPALATPPDNENGEDHEPSKVFTNRDLPGYEERLAAQKAAEQRRRQEAQDKRLSKAAAQRWERERQIRRQVDAYLKKKSRLESLRRERDRGTLMGKYWADLKRRQLAQLEDLVPQLEEELRRIGADPLCEWARYRLKRLALGYHISKDRAAEEQAHLRLMSEACDKDGVRLFGSQATR
jgi:hypothetical protein